MHDAIADAEISPDDIGAVNAHGTSTPTGDGTEVECLRAVFGKNVSAIPVSANKSQVGHSLGASAAIEAALAIEAMAWALFCPRSTISRIPSSATLMWFRIQSANIPMNLSSPIRLALAGQIAASSFEDYNAPKTLHPRIS